jgi:hypothetical protein
VPLDPAPPVLLGVQRLGSSQSRKHKHIEFQLTFNTLLAPATAVNVGNYTVIQSQRHHRRVIPISSARYDASTSSVIVALGHFQRRRTLSLTISGLVAAGTPVATIVTPL